MKEYNNTVDYTFPAPNSNSFSFTLLAMSGVAVPFLKNLYLSAFAPGWGIFIPW
jgi:hypothetical protein